VPAAPPGDLGTLLRGLRGLVAGFGGRALVMVGLGLALGAFDILVPSVAGWIVDAVREGRSASDLAWLVLFIAPLVWVPHGNLLPCLTQAYDLCRYRSPLAERVATETFARALAAAACPGDALVLQPVLCEGRDALDRLAGRVVREIPVAIRALAVFALVLATVPWLAPVLVVAGVLDLLVRFRAGARCRPVFTARDLAVKRQRRIEFVLLARFHGRPAERKGAAVACAAEAARKRWRAERDAGLRDARYKLASDILLNVSNVVTWGLVVWRVRYGGGPLGDLLVLPAWAARAGDLFGALTGLHQEFARGRHALEQLVALPAAPAGVGPESRNAPQGVTLRGALLTRLLPSRAGVSPVRLQWPRLRARGKLGRARGSSSGNPRVGTRGAADPGAPPPAACRHPSRRRGAPMFHPTPPARRS
jgi:hypothetical protein